MIALSFALLLELTASSSPAPPPAPSWPEGVVVKEREELPLVVAALSLPLDPAPTLLPLLASWLAQNESWPEGPVARLFAVGGRVEATAHPDGLVIVARGPASRQADVVAAALALLSDQEPSGAGFEPGRAEALAALSVARRDEDARLRRALWRAWYGSALAASRAGADEAALLEATEADARALLHEVKRGSAGHRLFLEGAARPAALPSVVGALRPAAAPFGPPSLPRPAGGDEQPGSKASAAPEGGSPSLLAVAHPLPPGPWSSPVGLAYALALERRLAPLGNVRVSVEAGRHARLLVVTVRPPPEPAEGTPEGGLLEAVRHALKDAREGALSDRTLRTELEQAAAALARSERSVGGWAERQARAHLAIPFEEGASGAASELDTLVGLLRISVLPEVLRAAPLPPPPPPPPPSRSAPLPEARAPSAASGGGRG